ncbi:MAG: lipopolysaccharide transport periplasmic protein LptA [Rhodoferax sp.]|uniref:lipopolysaccharide transport periplasmic protein LptA n=1 Tax=Rhodoferax sp. TaxID=50421 RepID=UPI00140123CA|nr:lipopolysaccharide transport periplasmic protein LptA [Rhodoferax sp.]NDP39763.1 lipopolysaccharide transport periplasmic protein LptA [Rhodoferax sp.]
MKPSLSTLLLSAALALFSGGACAEQADRNKPMNVEADALRYDDAKKTSVFTGRVVLTKGSILIRGARIEVRQDPDGNQYGVVTAEPGKLASFRQKREGLDEFIEGQGESIEYDSRANTVKFIRQAQLRRYLGATMNDEMSGNVIVYNNSTDVFTIDGGVAQGAPSATGGRVRAMLTPKPDAAAATPPAPAASAPAAALRATTTLDGEKK